MYGNRFAVITGALLAGAGILLWFAMHLPQPQPAEVAQLPAVTNYAGWKIYASKEYGFELKYPPQVTSVHEVQKGDTTVVEFVEQTGTTSESTTFSLSVIPKSADQTLKQWFSATMDYQDLLVSSGGAQEMQVGATSQFFVTKRMVPQEYFDHKGPYTWTHIIESFNKKYVLVFYPGADSVGPLSPWVSVEGAASSVAFVPQQ